MRSRYGFDTGAEPESMSVPFLILLAIAWAIFLVPPFVRNRSESRPGSSVVSFKHGLDVLGRTAPGSTLPRSRPAVALTPSQVRGRAAVRKRRRDVLFVLGGVAGFTLLLALAFGGSGLLLLHLLADAALAGYVYLLVQMRKAAVERANTVRYLAAPAQSQPTLVMVRRSASG